LIDNRITHLLYWKLLVGGVCLFLFLFLESISLRKFSRECSNDSTETNSSSNERKGHSVAAKKLGKNRKYKSKHKSRAVSSDSRDSDTSHDKEKSKPNLSSRQSKQYLRGHLAQQQPRSKHLAVQVFQKYYADILKLLKMVSEEVLHQLYSNQLIPLELITAKRSRVLKSLMNTVQAEPNSFLDIITFLEDELPHSSLLRDIKGNFFTLVFSV